jgi:putative addiction module killer protein
MRVNFGPGYRLYFSRRGSILIVMLAGGDKSTQTKDIKRAQKILKELARIFHQASRLPAMTPRFGE